LGDAELRDLERAVRASPGDEALSRRWLQELLRAGAVAPDAAPDVVEPVPNPGIAPGDLVLVARRSRPRAAFAWLPEMDSLLGCVLAVVRAPPPQRVGSIVVRDGLSCLLEGPSLLDTGALGPVIGRSVGFGSILLVRSRA
jgi:hypothetical protein